MYDYSPRVVEEHSANLGQPEVRITDASALHALFCGVLAERATVPPMKGFLDLAYNKLPL
jgi:hypothetical protein